MFSWMLNIFKKDKVLQKNRFFEIIVKTVDIMSDTKVKYVIIKCQTLKNQLMQFLPQCETLYDTKPQIPIELFFPPMDDIKQFNKNQSSLYRGNNIVVNGMQSLEKALDCEFKENFEKLKKMLKDGKISFPFLWYIFKKGTLFTTLDRFKSCMIGSMVQDCGYVRGFFVSSFHVNGRCISSNGKEFISHVKPFKVMFFKGVMNINELNLIPVKHDDKIVKEVSKRGEIFSKIAIGSHYRNYKGNIIRQGKYFNSEYSGNGRCMIDTACFVKMNPNYEGIIKGGGRYNYNSYQTGFTSFTNRNYRKYETKKFDSLTADQYFMCDSHVMGFSFRTKKWGEFRIDLLKHIKFNHKAFDSLVLDEKKKFLIKNFVINNNKTINDIIQNKGGGCILLLHGDPGTGKTLTCESIAELLKKPLYSCSIGELGTNVSELEKNLATILDICRIWKAVILIDEADIFLEERSKSDIQRNAMVGVFLRLLEYYNGVLFLTTNRVECFDKAFQSRISIAFHYEKLDLEARKKVWGNLLKFFNFDYSGLDIDKLGKYDINGRQIRTVIKLASTLSNDFNKKVNRFKIYQKDVIECIEFIKQFDIKDLEKKKESKSKLEKFFQN